MGERGKGGKEKGVKSYKYTYVLQLDQVKK